MALVDSYKSIIFDYGGVLVRHQTDADQAEMASLLGVPADRFTELYWAKRADYDEDALTAAEYWHEIASEAGAELAAAVLEDLIEKDTTSWMRFDEPMWNWVEELRKAKKRVAILSNMPRELGEALASRTQRLGAFDQVTLSYQVHAAKPDPAIYEHCLEGLGAKAVSTLFLDDRIENVQGAELLGIRAIQFLDRDEVLLQIADRVAGQKIS